MHILLEIPRGMMLYKKNATCIFPKCTLDNVYSGEVSEAKL